MEGGLHTIGSSKEVLANDVGFQVCRSDARRGWNGKGMWLSLVGVTSQWCGSIEGVENTMPAGWQGYSPFIAMYTADGMLVPWLASQTDVLAEDWTIVEEEAQ